MNDDLKVAQSERYDGHDWWSWAVWIEGAEETLDRIEWVEWILHPSFPTPVRRTTDRAGKFKLETGGWGTFRIGVRVQFKGGSLIKLSHPLSLSYPQEGSAPPRSAPA